MKLQANTVQLVVLKEAQAWGRLRAFQIKKDFTSKAVTRDTMIPHIATLQFSDVGEDF